MTDVPPRAATGVGALDAAIEGGLPASRVTLVTGDSGAGKTTLAMQFLAEGGRRGEPGIFIALGEKPAHIAEAAARFGWPISTSPGSPVLLLDGSPALSLMRQRQHAIDARAVMADLIPHIRAHHAARLVIDALPALVPPEFTEPEEEEFFRDLVFALEDNFACTTLVVTSDGDPRAARISAVAARLASGVIDLRLRETGGRLHRRMLVRKMRATASDGVERAFEIGASGLIAGQA
ncbi:MAG TPA: ATPase domain-containing protein [Vicinamibacterales bacterium]|nr:ATPase domain-containing protein [Vicinamibacterales bacterium]